MAKIYDHAYQPVSVYGNVVALLRHHAGKHGVHLDIGCGYGAIAEPIRDELGLTYLGLDGADDGLGALRERGFETQRVDLHDPAAVEATIRTALGGRPIASISIIDTLEHLINGPEVLDMLRRLVGEHQAHLVISVPHVAHKDIAIKALTGRWDYTGAGLLDHTHLSFFTESNLTSVTAQTGWRQVDAKDWLLEVSDQNFPRDFIPLQVATPLGNFLRSFAGQSNPNVLVNQFVRAYAPAERQSGERFVAREEQPPPAFMTVVIRTQCQRTHQLRDGLLSLAGQSLQDFNVVIVRHASATNDAAEVQRIVESFPRSFSDRVKIVDCGPGSRAAPLNAALAHIASRYIAFLDDDDFVFGHYIETFAKSAATNPGKILRSGCTRQQNSWRSESLLGPHASPSSWFETPYPAYYDLMQHLTDNHTPFMSVAFPVSLFRDLHLRFDESLSTAEDWDFTIRAAQLCGVASDPAITAVYRWWDDHSPSSRTEHAQEEWKANRIRIITKLNQTPLLLPPGAAVLVAKLLGQIDEQTAKLFATFEELQRSKVELEQSKAELEQSKAQEQVAVTEARAQLIALLNSPSWKKTKPLRKLLKRIRGNKKPELRLDNLPMTRVGLEHEIKKIKKSSSWRMTEPFRSAAKLLGRRTRAK